MDSCVHLLFQICVIVLVSRCGASFEPEFVEPVNNVTVPIGRDATLSCAVSHLGPYKVAWLSVGTQTILTIHRHVITRNYRIDLSHSDDRYWYLHIRDVQDVDRGSYMCQINTIPVKSQVGYLEVVIPPNIMDSETSTDVVAKEGANVNLTCRAEGRPDPLILWRREDGKKLLIGNHEAETVDGETLNFTRISRLHMGAYLCIASNSIPPSVSKRIILQVHFSPHTWIPNQLVGGYVNGEVILECNTEAFPKSINYWTTEQGDMITSGDKYEAILVDDVYRVSMQLKIRHLDRKDFGVYRCIARNFLGETDGAVNLYEIPAPTITLHTTSTEKINFETKELKYPILEEEHLEYEGAEDLYEANRQRPKADTVSDSGATVWQSYVELICVNTLGLLWLWSLS